MILLVVLAADSTVTLILTGRWRSAVMAAAWVGLAFQAKMLQAWLFLPALGLACLVAGRGTNAQRLGRIAVMGATVAVVSLSYMTFVALTPASQRPYADGSSTNSIYHQVFVYNGFSRVGQHSSSPDELLGDTLGTAIFTQAAPPPAWNRLLTASYGRDTGWLLPAAVISAIADRGGAPTGAAHRPLARRGAAVGRLAGRPRHRLQRQYDHELVLCRRAHSGRGRAPRPRRRLGLGVPWPSERGLAVRRDGADHRGLRHVAAPAPGHGTPVVAGSRCGRRRARRGRTAGVAGLAGAEWRSGGEHAREGTTLGSPGEPS